MAAERLLDLALNSAPRTRAVPDLCKRVRFRKSTCRTCSDVCPANAIALHQGPTISGSCSDCGLCEMACPTEVFRNELRTDQQLLAEAASFLPQEPTRSGTQALSVGCHRAEMRSGDGIRVPCLGRVSENILLGAALLGFDALVLIKGTCAECRWKQGEQVLARSICRYSTLLQLGGYDSMSIRLEEKDRGNQTVLPRRELFVSLGRRLRKQMAVFVQHKGQAVREALGNGSENAACVAPRWEHLRTLLRHGAPLDGGVAPYTEWLPWARVAIDEVRCSACGICVRLCPTAAISQEEQPGYAVLGFRAFLCINCTLCREACPEGAIRFEEQVSYGDVVDGERRVVARVSMSECYACGDTIPAGAKELCPTCEKRQAWLTHVELQRRRGLQEV